MGANDGKVGAGHLLSARGLAISISNAPSRPVTLVDQVAIDVDAGETLAIVGESGCGKSLTCRSLIADLPPVMKVAGHLTFRGRQLKDPLEARRWRGTGIGFVSQDPLASLNPVRTIRSHLLELLRYHRGLTGSDAREDAIRRLAEVGFADPPSILTAFPHQLSGGQNQRIAIALALAGDPQLLIADEPTTALDMILQARIFALLRELKHRRDLSVILVTHDLGLVAENADRALVFYAGRIVEAAKVGHLLEAPQHPYTAALVETLRRLGQRDAEAPPLVGTAPQPAARPAGCAFAPRCRHAAEICRQRSPPLEPTAGERAVACFRPLAVPSRKAFA